MAADLTTNYLGFTLANPLVLAASPLTRESHLLQRLQQAGAAAAVLPSLFQEQIDGHSSLRQAPDAVELDDYNGGADGYLRYIEVAKKSVSIPIIASLNGVAVGTWVRFARLIQQAGADALELNIYFVPIDPKVTGADVEQRYVDVVAAVRAEVSIPLAVKLGPYFSSLPNMARRLVAAGADGLVLFNRFVQPDIDLAALEARPQMFLSRRDEMFVPLRWIAILRGQFAASLAATSGIQEAEDVVKVLLAGADVAMLASILLRRGPEHLTGILGKLNHWLDERGFRSIQDLKGLASQGPRANTDAFARADYTRAIASYPS